MLTTKLSALVAFSLPLTVLLSPSPCPNPSEVPENQYPEDWVKGKLQFSEEDWQGSAGPWTKRYWMDCPKTAYIGAFDSTKRSFVMYKNSFLCNKTSGKWYISLGDNKVFEAPKYLSCGNFKGESDIPKGGNCKVLHYEPNGGFMKFTIYPRHEQYCPVGQKLQYDNGTAISRIQCTGTHLEITSSNRPLSIPVDGSEHLRTKLTCVRDTTVEIACKAPFQLFKPQVPEPLEYDGDVIINNDKKTFSCPEGIYVGRSPEGSVFAFKGHFFCDTNTGRWITNQGYVPPTNIVCAKPRVGTTAKTCPVIDRQKSGARLQIELIPERERYYCPNFQVPHYENGNRVNTISCIDGKLEIDGMPSNNPILECKCPFGYSRKSEYFMDHCEFTACPLPMAVNELLYPKPHWTRTEEVSQRVDGTDHYLQCPTSTFIGQIGMGADPHTFVGDFKCDPDTKKWVDANGHEAPPYVSCGNGDSRDSCRVNNVQSDLIRSSISIYPGYEYYCPPGTRTRLNSTKIINFMNCKGKRLEVEYDGKRVYAPDPIIECK